MRGIHLKPKVEKTIFFLTPFPFSTLLLGFTKTMLSWRHVQGRNQHNTLCYEKKEGLYLFFKFSKFLILISYSSFISLWEMYMIVWKWLRFWRHSSRGQPIQTKQIVWLYMDSLKQHCAICNVKNKTPKHVFKILSDEFIIHFCK